MYKRQLLYPKDLNFQTLTPSVRLLYRCNTNELTHLNILKLFNFVFLVIAVADYMLELNNYEAWSPLVTDLMCSNNESRLVVTVY